MTALALYNWQRIQHLCVNLLDHSTQLLFLLIYIYQQMYVHCSYFLIIVS